MDIVGAVFSCIETGQEASGAVAHPSLKAPAFIIGCAGGVVDPNPPRGP
jgi:hypothetical protein